MSVEAPAVPCVHRIEVRPKAQAGDPRARALIHDAAGIGIPVRSVRTARVYLIEADLTADQIETIRTRLLEDPVIEEATVGASAAADGETTIEVHPLPGVMDPAAQTVAAAIGELVGVRAEVVTAWRYDLAGVDRARARAIAQRLLANPVVHAIYDHPHLPAQLPKGSPAPFRVTHIEIRSLDDAALERLSRDAHLFLSLDEMRAIRDEYRRLGREPTDIELETLAQTWSEHCVHKTLKSTICYRSTDPDDPVRRPGRPGHEVHDDGSVTIRNLLKSTVAAATHELIAEGLDWTLSVFVDNAGVIRLDDRHAVCVKVETHNHPSAIEPYGGAATGIGGCIRDIIGTGLAAKPIASTDVFCVARPNIADVPAGCLHPRRILTDVVAGVRDYGNRMGIPTVNGAVWFDDRYVGNPLVFCGCVGLMPGDRITGSAQPGDLIVALGGRTGRDGIHGATFSSAELTDTHADEFAHAVQIGNAIEEKRVLDAILRARDHQQGPLFSAITDCGAGGFSSAVGEMGEHLGAEVHLDRAPLKYAGLTYTEIWISEAQERMVLAVAPKNLDALRHICDEEHVELCVLGTFGTPDRTLVLKFNAQEVGCLSMDFLHNGIPTPTRQAVWTRCDAPAAPGRSGQHAADRSEPFSGDDAGRRRLHGSHGGGLAQTLLELLAHPNIASKHFIIRQYDHEVQGNTVIRPLGGPQGRGPMDAAVIEPVPGTNRGIAIGCGLATGLERDPYRMALAAIDECVRNLVCVGADPERIAILDNFCWPSCAKPGNLASLVRAAEGCYDGAKAYRTPFISGKDSLNNQFTTVDGRTIEIPPTLLITGVGIVEDVRRCVTMDAKQAGNRLYLVGVGACDALGGSTWAMIRGEADLPLPGVDPAAGARAARLVAALIREGTVVSAHDVSDGGLLVAVAEMLIAGSTRARPIGAALSLDEQCPPEAFAFGEAPGRYVLEVPQHADRPAWRESLPPGVWVRRLGTLDDTGVLTDHRHALSVGVEELAAAWLGTLDW
ncbi:MAG: phosphoribosylformylglycinamidine synthase subunit PurL [Phycisphaerales bacterium]